MTSTAHATTVPTLFFSEVAWAGSSLSTSDEWLELWNPSTEPQDLSGWYLEGAGESGKRITLPAGTRIDAQRTYLITNFPDTDARNALLSSAQLVTSTLSLSNSALHLVLHAPDGTVMDDIGTGGTPPAGKSGAPPASMSRTIEYAWETATQSQGFKPGLLDFGTPGSCDTCFTEASPQSPPELPTPPDPELPPASEALPVETAPTNTTAELPGASEPPTEPVAIEPDPIPVPTELPPEISDTPPVTFTVDLETPTEAVATSTTEVEIVVEPFEYPTPVTSTTPELLLEPESAEPATNTEMTTTSESSPPILSETPTPENATTTTPTNCSVLRLNEFLPNPSSGFEWIELVNPTSDRVDPSACTLHDSVGKIRDLKEEPILEPMEYRVFTLSSAKLNNSGDTVQLVLGDVRIDDASFENAVAGQSFGRLPDATGNWAGTTPTPGSSNLALPIPEPVAPVTPPPITTQPAPEPIIAPTTPVIAPIVTTTAPPTPTILISPVPTSTVATTKPKTVKTKTIKPKTSPVKTLTVSTSTETISNASKPRTTKSPSEKSATKKAPAKTNTPKKTTKRVSTAPAIQNYTEWPSFTEIMSLNPNIHVRLRGTVGTPPRLLGSHAFVLLSEDGRGLLVSVPTKQALPSIGASISVTGILSFDSKDLPRLKMGTKDAWKAETLMTRPRPRSVDVLFPSSEDAWSYLTVTGTVLEVKSQKVLLEVEGSDFAVIMKPVTEYRAARLTKGDLVHVAGVLDLTSTDPALLIRSAADVNLLARQKPTVAAMNTATVQPTIFPNWTPFGSAMGAIVAVEGIKRADSWRKRKKIAPRKQLEFTTG